jgi:hypothetical protein
MGGVGQRGGTLRVGPGRQLYMHILQHGACDGQVGFPTVPHEPNNLGGVNGKQGGSGNGRYRQCAPLQCSGMPPFPPKRTHPGFVSTHRVNQRSWHPTLSQGGVHTTEPRLHCPVGGAGAAPCPSRPSRPTTCGPAGPAPRATYNPGCVPQDIVRRQQPVNCRLQHAGSKFQECGSNGGVGHSRGRG